MRFSGLSSIWRILTPFCSRRPRTDISARASEEGRGDARQREVEGGARVRGAVGQHPPAVELDELLADGKTESGTAHVARDRVVHALERLEEPPEVFLADPDARVAHAHVNRVAVDAGPDDHA